MLAEDADGGNIPRVKQYRHAVDEEIYEIPAGLVEEGESPEETAARELQEEIGRRPGRMEKIAELYSSPGLHDREDNYVLRDGALRLKTA